MIKWILCEKNIEKFEGPLDYQINIPGCQSHNINLYDAVFNCLGRWHTLKTFLTKSTHTYFIDNCSGTDHVYKRSTSLPVELIRRSSGCLSWNPLGGHINSTTAEKQIKNYSLIASFLATDENTKHYKQPVGILKPLEIGLNTLPKKNHSKSHPEFIWLDFWILRFSQGVRQFVQHFYELLMMSCCVLFVGDFNCVFPCFEGPQRSCFF